MLYLVRKLDEAIIINNNIKVKVIEIKRNSVKLGFDFPETSTVFREETYNKISQQNLEATEFAKNSEKIISSLTEDNDPQNSDENS